MFSCPLGDFSCCAVAVSDRPATARAVSILFMVAVGCDLIVFGGGVASCGAGDGRLAYVLAGLL